jgi:glycosyltransferase involved in cell wall biosynthesis
MQGGGVELAEAALVAVQHKPDLILATSMLDLATFSALTRRHFASVPLVLYMHENQLTYPVTKKGSRSHAAGMTQWKAMLCADHIFFNSAHHRDSLFAALPGFLSSAPDFDHRRFVDEVQGKSSVLYVGVDIPAAPADKRTAPPLILWNQRWSHDKNPEAMLHSLVALDELELDFRVAICGGEPNARIPLFEEVRERLGARVVHFGWASESEYSGLVQRADIVLSTARHEFFGIAVMEALRSGAMGVLPNRLAYPELVEPQSASRQLYNGAEERMRLLAGAVRSGGFTAAERESIAPYYARYDWSSLAPKYDARLSALALKREP